MGLIKIPDDNLSLDENVRAIGGHVDGKGRIVLEGRLRELVWSVNRKYGTWENLKQALDAASTRSDDAAGVKAVLDKQSAEWDKALVDQVIEFNEWYKRKYGTPPVYVTMQSKT